MSAILLTWTVCLLLCASGLTAGDQHAEALGRADLQFSTDLFRTLFFNSVNNNVFFSPNSLFNAALNVLVAAADIPELRLQNFLRIIRFTKLNRDYFIKNHLNKPLKFNKAYELMSEDQIYHSDDIKEKPDKITNFGNRVVTLKSGTDSATQINKWVSDITKGNIKHLYRKGNIRSSGALVFVNAALFEGHWLLPFKSSPKADFLNLAGKYKKIYYMKNKAAMIHSMTDNELKAKIISLPYKGGDISMIIILPIAKPSKNGTSIISPIVDKLRRLKIEAIVSKLHSQEKCTTDLLIPSFKVDSQYFLMQIFRDLTGAELFDHPIDFGYLFSQERLQIGSVVHETVVKMHKDGTLVTSGSAITDDVVEHSENETAHATEVLELNEAGTAVANASVITERAGHSASKAEFHANYPFVFIIYDKARKYAHFMGVVSNP